MKNIVLKQDIVILAGTVLTGAPSKIELDVESNRECTLLGLPLKDSTFTPRLGFDESEVDNNPLVGWEGDPIEPRSPVSETRAFLAAVKALRESIDKSPNKGRARSLIATKLEEAELWALRDLEGRELIAPEPCKCDSIPVYAPDGSIISERRV